MILELSVARQDNAKIIGKQGRTVSAMGTILNAVRWSTIKHNP